MRVVSLPVSPRLAPFVRCLRMVEAYVDVERLLLPDTSVIVGLRYRGAAFQVDGEGPTRLPGATLAGMRSRARIMRTQAGSGVLLATFHDGAPAQFFGAPLHELFGATLDLDALLPARDVARALEQMQEARDTPQRLALFEHFLLGLRQPRARDRQVIAAASLLRESHGQVRIHRLARQLSLSIDSLEKRFRRELGASPKQLAGVLRLQRAVDVARTGVSLGRSAIEAGYCDQSHFIRAFRAMAGVTPQRFLAGKEHC